MALNEVVNTWIALPITPFDFFKRGISNVDYFLLLDQAAKRAKTYILNTLQIPQVTFDTVDGINNDEFQVAFQWLACYELLRLNIGLFADVISLSRYRSPEGEEAEQTNESFNRYLNAPQILKNQAEVILNKYIPENLKSSNSLTASTFNWC